MRVREQNLTGSHLASRARVGLAYGGAKGAGETGQGRYKKEHEMRIGFRPKLQCGSKR